MTEREQQLRRMMRAEALAIKSEVSALQEPLATKEDYETALHELLLVADRLGEQGRGLPLISMRRTRPEYERTHAPPCNCAICVAERLAEQNGSSETH